MFGLNRKKKSSSRVMVQCRTEVKKDAVRRETIDGLEHIVVSSSTLPNDIIMNGGLYPADEIAKSFESLELTLAPVEHPHVNGQFISATDPRAIHEFHAGAFNMNVRQEGGRIHIDKYINVAEALKTDRGKRLLDRIEELETNEAPRPIHTSVGVWLVADELKEPKVNSDGEEYTWIANDMTFDHDAILLDSVGAAQPNQGVGMAVNAQGDEFKVNTFDIAQEKPQGKSFDRLKTLFDNVGSNVDGLSFDEIRKSVDDALERSAMKADYIEELFTDKVIFWSGDTLFEVPFTTDSEGISTIVGIPLTVERNVSFSPKVNQHIEEIAMKDMILNALKKAGVATDGLSDEQLFAAHSQLLAVKPEDKPVDTADLASIVANAVTAATAPLSEKIEGLQAKMNSADEAEVDKLAGLIANSGKYAGLDAESAKLLGVDKLKEMAANCSSAFGLSPVFTNNDASDEFKAPSDVPE